MSMNGSSGEAGVERVCVIDLGTNSFHALIFELHPDRVPRIVDRLKEPVGLGAGGLASSTLTHSAVARAEAALRRIRTLAERRGVGETRAYATSAIREARNGGDFVEHVRREVGVDIRPIPGELEAKLIYLGVRESVDLSQPSLIVDIGGGSTEFVIGDHRELRFAKSLKLGAARLTESFVSGDPISGDDLARLTAHLDEQLAPVLQAAREHGVQRLIGSSGTLESLGELIRSEKGLGGSVFQHAFSPEDGLTVARWLVGSSRKDRLRHGLEAPRVDQIVAGAVLLTRLLESLALERVAFSPGALRDGMVVELLAERGEEMARTLEEPDLDRRRCLRLGLRHRFDEPHARHVARLAGVLFEGLDPLHDMGDRQRRVLDHAALLHDVGHAVSGRGHHKHTLYVLENAEWPGVDPDEVSLTALVARYHRGARPRRKHRRYRRLGKGARRDVRQLAAMLRLADRLDRSHVQNTADLEVDVRRNVVQVRISTRGDPGLELAAAGEADEAFERAFGRKLEVVAAWNG